ncbi:tyrosine--tRNA ligase, partial [Patescibacteria group bacterium]|nr:tyrosine--tRNA ligase [Patescibacteria group bacterium]
KIKKDLKSKKLHPRDAKVWLAKEIVALYHDPQAANRAEVEFDRVFKQKKLPDKMPSFKLSYKKLNVLEILMKTKLVSSRSEGKRFVSQKGVKIDGEIQLDWHKVIQLDKEMVIQVGKRGFAKIET